MALHSSGFELPLTSLLALVSCFTSCESHTVSCLLIHTLARLPLVHLTLRLASRLPPRVCHPTLLRVCLSPRLLSPGACLLSYTYTLLLLPRLSLPFEVPLVSSSHMSLDSLLASQCCLVLLSCALASHVLCWANRVPLSSSGERCWHVVPVVVCCASPTLRFVMRSVVE